MIQGLVQHGRIEVQEPIPAEWEGQLVKIAPLTPDDPMPDLDQTLAALHALGAMEYEPGEREEIAVAMAELDAAGKAEMDALSGSKP
jgi:hypothetical protein